MIESSAPPRPLCVFFDANAWIEMARSARDGTGPWWELLSAVRSHRAAERLVVPLTASLYRELWHRGRHDSRRDVAELMREISGYATLGAVDSVRRSEIDAYVHRWFLGSDSRVTRADVLGYGANHAFGSKHGRFRFVEWLATDASDEGRECEPPSDFEKLKHDSQVWEWLNLFGEPALIDSDGLDRTPEYREGAQFARREEEMRKRLAASPDLVRRLADLIVAQEVSSITDDLNNSCIEAQFSPYGLFFDSRTERSPQAAMRALVAGLPTVDVLANLRLLKHQDRTHPWEQHDRADLTNLSVAVPYCDVVVTEKRWSHLCTVSRIAEKYGTRVVAGPARALQAIQ